MQSLTAWYDMSSFNLGTQTWASKVNTFNSAVFQGTAVTIATDVAGSTGSAAAMSYINGSNTSYAVFPELYSGSSYSLCTVSRYTSSTWQQRIFQSTTTWNWVHGAAPCVCAGVHFRAALNLLGWRD